MTQAAWTLEGYELDAAPLFEGRHALFYRARRVGEDASLGWPLLVKRLHPQLTEDADREQLFLQGAALACRLEHPHLVRVLAFGMQGECGYLVMERLAGVRLSKALPRLLEVGGRLPVVLVAQLGMALSAALHTVHGAADARAHPLGFIHLGVAPENILLTFGGRVKLLGVGVIKLEWQAFGFRGGLSLNEERYRYMSPEHIRGRTLDARTDVFSLGLVLHELLTGEPLFARDSSLKTFSDLLNAPIPSVCQARHEVPEVLGRIIARCLERDLEQRYPDAGSLREDLRAFLAPLGAPPLEVQLPPLLWPLSGPEAARPSGEGAGG
jgi:serine/threonine-protein kinase